MTSLLGSISDFLWGAPLLVALLATHLFLTFRLRFVQRWMGVAIRISFKRGGEGPGDISHFGALTTALAATIGTGNIIGVGTAVAAGGPGAVFWMWITGVFGIATKYGEAVLAIKYREQKADGSFAGGPMYVLEKGLGAKWLAILFAFFTALAALGIGNAVQANALASLSQENFGISPLITGLVLAALTALVILGGIQSVARVCERFVPLMALLYILGCLAILLTHISEVPQALWLILESAFSGQAAVGGFAGATIREVLRFGVARGLFSNEAGLGSAPIVAAAARTANPVRQALVSASGTFWDTVVVCALTGTVLVIAGDWTSGAPGDLLTRKAFTILPFFGPTVLNIALLTFVFSTILGWSYYGEKAIEYLFGSKIILPYRILWVVIVAVGATTTMEIVWQLADIANALMALPNLIALLALNGVIVAETKKHLWDKATFSSVEQLLDEEAPEGK